jgi:tetratricopeptide (TPR) repeat protein
MSKIHPSHLLVIVFCLTLCGFSCAKKNDDLDAIAQVYLNGGDLEKVLTSLNQYTTMNPKDDMGWVVLGNILEELDRDTEAEASYQKALAISPRNFRAITALGILLRKTGNYDGALEYYKKALDIDPNYAQAYSSMAIIQLKKKNDQEALRLAKLGYEKDQTDPVVAANLAVICHYCGETKLRDNFTEIAKTLGYKNMDSLQQIYSGEISVRD